MKPNVFSYSDYRRFLKDALDWSHKGKGKLLRLASFLKIHPSRLSRILNEADHPTPEQAYLIGQFLGLGELDGSYFAEMVNLERASHPSFRNHISGKLRSIRHEAEGPAELTPFDRPLTASEEKVYYSSYLYGAVWLSSMVSGRNTAAQIAKNLKLDPQAVERICAFLVSTGLCGLKDGRVVPGARLLKIESDSPQIEKFLGNWRMRGIEKIAVRGEEDLFYSEPMAISEEGFHKVKALLRQTAAEIRKILEQAPGERVACLNWDWYEV